MERWPLSHLHPHPQNYRRHPERQLAILRESLRVHGQQKPVVVTAGGTILAGHGLVEAARAEGWAEVLIHVYDGPHPEAFLVLDNRASDLAEDDAEALAALLQDLEGAGNLEASGYGEDDLRELLACLERPETGDWEQALSALPEGEKSPFEQMTFTLHEEQAALVREALEAAKRAGPFAEGPNENSNGNGLVRICAAYLEGA